MFFAYVARLPSIIALLGKHVDSHGNVKCIAANTVIAIDRLHLTPFLNQLFGVMVNLIHVRLLLLLLLLLLVETLFF